MLRIWFILLSLFFHLNISCNIQQEIFARNNKIKFDNYTVENGLSHNYIDCIYQDKYGWIWLGTGMGIDRFDGYWNWEILSANRSIKWHQGLKDKYTGKFSEYYYKYGYAEMFINRRIDHTLIISQDQ